MKLKNARRRLAVVSLMTAAACSSLAASGLALSAEATTVPNQFIRTCTWSCSAYWQSNGTYRPNYPSVCYTKYWNGSYQKDKTVWGPCR